MKSWVSDPVRSLPCRLRSRVVGCALGLMMVVGETSLASAQAEDRSRARARTLGAAGLAALRSGDARLADQKLTEALALFRAPTLYLARGKARLRRAKLLTAAEDFRAASEFPVQPGEMAAFGKARDEAGQQLAALQQRIPTLTVEVSGQRPTRLIVNGVEWPVTAVGKAHRLNPGRYEVEAASGSDRTAKGSVELAQEQHAKLVLDLSLRPAPSAEAIEPSTAAAAQARAQVPATTPGGPPQATRATADASAPNWPVWVSGGVTVLLATASIVTGVLYGSRKSDFDDANDDPDKTTEERQELHDSAAEMGTVNAVLVGATLVGGAATTYLWLSQPELGPAESAQPRARLRGVGGAVRVEF